MDNNEKILINKEILEKIKGRLEGLRLMSSEKDVKKDIESLIQILSDEIDSEKLSFRDLLDEKIRDTKYSDSELNFKLYMLRRKLEDGKISDEEALKAYDLYVSGHAGDF